MKTGRRIQCLHCKEGVAEEVIIDAAPKVGSVAVLVRNARTFVCSYCGTEFQTPEQARQKRLQVDHALGREIQR